MATFKSVFKKEEAFDDGEIKMDSLYNTNIFPSICITRLYHLYRLYSV